MTVNEIALKPIDRTFALPTIDETQGQLSAIVAFQKACQSYMIDGSDYGVIPGTQKPTLLKPGAEKIIRLLGLADEYEIESVKDWDKPFFHFQVVCRLRHLASGQIVATGVGGNAIAWEKRYRWRKAERVCPICNQEAIIKGKQEYGGGWLCFGKRGGCGAKFKDGDPDVEGQETGRVLNEDIYSQVNTILKMAKKRSCVDAALSAGRLSDVFTQDLEDLTPERNIDAAPPQRASQSHESAPPQRSNWQMFNDWLAEHGRTIADVSAAIGTEATTNSVGTFIKESDLQSFGKFSAWLESRWSLDEEQEIEGPGGNDDDLPEEWVGTALHGEPFN